MQRRILVIEDEEDLAELLALHLRDVCQEVRVTGDGAQGLAIAESGDYDLIILDLMLPGMPGLDVCRRLRAQPRYTPILMLTARSSEIDRVLGLELGADDYLTKPFSLMELNARVKAIFRRLEALAADSAPALGSVGVGELHIEVEKRRVTFKGRPIELTRREFELLLHFCLHPGRVYTRAQLLDAVWGYGHAGYEHTVNSHINRLRAKIEEDPAHPCYILTVWGVGYRFTDSAGEAPGC